jgi:diketogulonate reductase-like aldo/keto reductase
MEALHDAGRARLLGVSNVTAEQLREVCAGARVRPRFVQNRCFAALGWDRDVRAFCSANGLTYQGFSLLTANPQVLVHSDVGRIARHHGRTPAQVVFRFALDVGMIPLTGTTSPEHMRADLDAFTFVLAPDETKRIERIDAP